MFLQGQDHCTISLAEFGVVFECHIASVKHAAVNFVVGSTPP